MKNGLLSTTILGILFVSSLALVSQASGTSFSTPLKLGAGSDPNVQSVGNHVYVAWTDGNKGIMFRSSSDGGHSWSAALKIGNGGQYPIMSVNGNNVYMVWSSGGICFAWSSDNGVTWSKPVKIAPSGAITPFIASNGPLVSVVYLSNALGGQSYVTSSLNSGKSWTIPFQFSNGPEPQIAISGSNIYVIADNIDKSHIQFGVSHDSGTTWTISSLAPGSEPWIVATGSNVYSAWETKGSSSVVWFLSSSDNGNTRSTKIISASIPDAWNPMINAAGNTVWVGIQELGGKSQNWILTSTDGGGTWSSKSLTGLGHTDGFLFGVPTSDGSNVFALWLQKNTASKWDVFVAYSSNGGTTWSMSSIGSSDPNNDVAIGSVSSNGVHGFAVWQHGNAIWFAYS